MRARSGSRPLSTLEGLGEGHFAAETSSGDVAAHEQLSEVGVALLDGVDYTFVLDLGTTRMREQEIHCIIDIFTRQADTPGYARMVPVSEIASERSDHNLNLPRYIDSSEPEDIQDIAAHLPGGIHARDIGALNRGWRAISGIPDAPF